MPFDQLRGGVSLPFDPSLVVPELHEVTIDVPSPEPVADVEATARAAVVAAFPDQVEPGMTVAVGAGSRGLTGRVELLRGAISGLRDLGSEPFVVPAMGSHGGATADGQRAMLAHLGVTAETIGAEIRSTMDTVRLGTTASGMDVHLDAHAAAADRMFPINRVKPHTSYRGPIESGLTKMAVVGFGKRPGAAQVHSCGPIEMRDRILDGIGVLRSTGRLLGGVASLESASGAVVAVRALTADDIGGPGEVELTELARALVPPLPFGDIDVLIIERGGKDISGTTMDPNVIGRFWVNGLDDLDAPRVSAVVLLSATEVSEGNLQGIGLADFVPASLAREVDWAATYVNSFTAGPAGLRRSRLPMVLPDEESCIKAALSMCGRAIDQPKRVVRIGSTLHLTRAWVSDAVLADLPPNVRGGTPTAGR
jgi:hypothetical protein